MITKGISEGALGQACSNLFRWAGEIIAYTAGELVVNPPRADARECRQKVLAGKS